MKRLLKIIIVAVLVGAIFAPASIAMAASGTRDLPSTVAAGSNFDIDISVSDFGAFGQVVETLPGGFSYVSSTLSAAAVETDGQDVYFTLLQEDTTFSYTVTASDTAGTYSFSGILKDEDKETYTIGGDTQIIVPATRSMPTSITAGASFDIDISTFDFGAFGQVLEELPAGFSYVSSTLSAAAVDVEGQEVKFTLLAEDTDFSYTVAASSTAGTHTFDGTLKDENKDEYPIGGQDQITVSATATTGGGGGGGGGAAAGTTYLYEFITSSGKFVVSVTAKSQDGLCELSIPRDTISLKTNGQRPTKITIVKISAPHGAPQNMSTIGNAYDLGPDGLTFDPPVTLTFTYNPASLPEGINEENLAIAYWDINTNEWVVFEGCTVDIAANTICIEISHFTEFSVLAHTQPATFSFEDLSIKHAEVDIGQNVTISVTVSNTGDLSGSYDVVLKVNDVTADTQEVTLAGGASQKVTFTITKDVAGTYTITIGEVSGKFTVKAPPAPTPEPEPKLTPTPAPAPEPEPTPTPTPEPAPAPTPTPEPEPTNWPLIGGIIGGVIVVGLIIFFLVRRRAQ